MNMNKVFSLNVFQISVLLLCMAINSCNGRVQLPPNLTVPAVFAFGDSIVDPGNNNDMQTLAKANFPPYGKDLDAGIPMGRFCNGKTPPDLIAEELGIKDLVPAYQDPKLKPHDLLTGVSFASGASGFDPETSKTALAIPLSSQLEYFKEYKEKLVLLVSPEKAKEIVSDGLYLVVAGSDDLANTYFTLRTQQLHYDIPAYTDFIVSAASSFLQELYKLGARRIAVFGIPPIGCLPSQRTLAGGLTRECNERYNLAAQLTNSKLSPMTDSLTQRLPQSRVVYVDIYNPLLDLIQKPQNYGFEVNDRGCCGTGAIEAAILCNKYGGTCPDDTKYIFWDSYHPTEKTYKILISKIIQTYVKRFI